jgi:pimeloyl-ACP methyl ester carboxylesterase
LTGAKEILEGFEEHRLGRRGVAVRYWVGGAGPPLLLVHGYGGAAWNFAELAPLLAPRHRLVIPDLPGHGGSAPLPAAPNLAAYADSLVAVCDEEGTAAVDVVGHSLGGSIGVRLAARRPELVRRLVLAAAAGLSSSTRAAELLLTFAGIVQPGRFAARRPERVARSPFLRRLVFSRFSASDPWALSERSIRGFLRGPALHTDLLSAAEALVREEPRVDLGRVTCPVLCLWGARDLQAPVDDGIEYTRRLRGSLRVIADCGHLLIGERPDACVDAIEQFLA